MSKKIRKQEGITLVALVITIIILLILAGISIQALTGTGLFEKTNQAKERTIKAQLKEEIEMAIQEIQMEEIPEGRTVDLKLLYNGKLEGKLENIIMEWSEDGITGEYKDYEYVIDDKLNVTIEGKVGVKPKITYELSSTEPQQKEITITVKATISEGEVTSIVNPDNEEIIGNEITYKVTKNGKYTFIAKSSTGTRAKEKINVTNIKITEPIISVMQIGGYPLMTSNGIVGTLSKVQIAYEDNPNLVNYYSEDNGTTWNEYKGTIETGKSKIMAKSVVKDNEQIVSDITTLNIDLPGDALEEKTYDGDNTTSVNISNTKKRMNISSDVYGKNICVDYTSKATSSTSSGYTSFNFYDINNNLLSKNKYTSNSRGIKEFMVPNDSAYMILYRYYGTATIYEIVLANEPIISSTQHYPLLSEKGVETGYCTAQISYDSTSIQKLYKINEGEWQDYNEQIITLKIDDILYAKGIDKNGKETRKISSYTSTLPLDAIEIKAYDKNNTTSIDIHDTTKRININSDIYGKTIYVDYTSKATSNSTSGYTTFRFYDTNNNLLSENKYTSNSRGVKEFIVPNNSAYMTVYRYYGTATIYEISLMKDI